MNRPVRGRRRVRPDRRVPAWVVLPVAAAAGFFVSGWLGLVFGAVVGVFLWRIRR